MPLPLPDLDVRTYNSLVRTSRSEAAKASAPSYDEAELSACSDQFVPQGYRPVRRSCPPHRP